MARESERLRARMALVDEHVRCENRHDVEALMATFGMDAEAWGCAKLVARAIRWRLE